MQDEAVHAWIRCKTLFRLVVIPYDNFKRDTQSLKVARRLDFFSRLPPRIVISIHLYDVSSAGVGHVNFDCRICCVFSLLYRPVIALPWDYYYYFLLS